MSKKGEAGVEYQDRAVRGIFSRRCCFYLTCSSPLPTDHPSGQRRFGHTGLDLAKHCACSAHFSTVAGAFPTSLIYLITARRPIAMLASRHIGWGICVASGVSPVVLSLWRRADPSCRRFLEAKLPYRDIRSSHLSITLCYAVTDRSADDRVRMIALAMGLVSVVWTLTTGGVSLDWIVAGGSVVGPDSVAQFENTLGIVTTLDTGF